MDVDATIEKLRLVAHALQSVKPRDSQYENLNNSFQRFILRMGCTCQFLKIILRQEILLD